MQTERTMRVINVREIQTMEGPATTVEMTLTDDSASGAMMPAQTVTCPIAEQVPVGTKYTVFTTYTEIVA